MATRRLNVEIAGDSKSLGVAAGQADRHMDGLGKSATRMGKTMALGFAAAGAAAAGALAVGLKKSVDAAMDAEKSQARLQAQLKASGISYQAHAKQIDAVIQKHSQLAGVDDEDLQDALTNIIRATGSVNVAMKDAALVTDIARAKHIDLAKAGDLVAKVHAGNTGVLKRYGIAFAPITEAQDKLKASGEKYTEMQMRAAKATDKASTSQDALAQLQRRFAGQAEAYGKTAAGAQERFGVAVENLQEKIGSKLLPVVANVTNKVASFVSGMETGKGSGGRFAAAMGDAADKLKGAWGTAVAAVRRFIDRNRDDIDSLIHAFKNVGIAIKAVVENVIFPIFRRLIPFVKSTIDNMIQIIRGLIRIVSGVLTGDWRKAWEGVKDVVGGIGKQILNIIKNLGGALWDGVKAVGKLIGKGIVAGLKGLGGLVKDAVVDGVTWAAKNVPTLIGKALRGLGHAITSAISSGFGKLNPIGDGLGDGVGFIAGGGGGTASLMGADPDLFPIVQTAGRFGLHTSSGLRPGAITSSGNVSYHSSGDAVDEAGSPGAMLRFFNYMKNTAGPKLRELIYTPGGVGIKDGRPFRYTGQVARDHFDHVHVAYTGPFGDGIGQIRNLWTREGGSSSVANMAAAVAMAESGGDPNITHRNSDGSIDRGLWQINSRHGAMSTLDRAGNARAAIQISGNGRNWNPWTVFRTGAYKRFLTVDGGKSAKKAKPLGPYDIRGDRTAPSSGGTASGGQYDPATIYNRTATRMVGGVRVPVDDLDFQPFTGKGIKGLPSDLARPAVEQPDPGEPYVPPTQEDYTLAAIARARLTEGTDDDIREATNLVTIRKAKMDAALADIDPRNDSEAIDAYLQATDALKQLKDAIEADTKAREEQRKQYETLIAEDYRTKYNVSQSQYAVLAEAIAGVTNGFLGQRLGLGLSGLRAPAGAVARA